MGVSFWVPFSPNFFGGFLTVSAKSTQQQPSQVMEHLEKRLLMRAPRPVQIASAYLDNRGQAFFSVTVQLDKTTLSRKTASILTAGVDGQFGTADDVRVYTAVGYRKGRLSLRADLALNTPYRVRLNASVIKDVNGLALDGEFKGNGVASGDGFAGGNYDVVTATPTKTRIRFTTVEGYINVGLYKNTPTTKANFLHYANEAAWDNTFFHRSEHHHTGGNDLDVIQGGGFNVTNGQIGSVHMETGINVEGTNSNLAGTIAMARGQALNSNTNQWFFNTKPNTVLDGQYTVFGAVLDAESMATITAINNFTIVDQSGGSSTSPFGELPVVDPAAGTTRQVNVPGDLVMVTRVAALFDAAATPNVQAAVQRSLSSSGSSSSSAAAIQPAAAVSPFLVTTPTKNAALDDEA
jgi:cyclophilin family peptidyl-prolyl cis-trans isomerase